MADDDNLNSGGNNEQSFAASPTPAPEPVAPEPAYTAPVAAEQPPVHAHTPAAAEPDFAAFEAGALHDIKAAGLDKGAGEAEPTMGAAEASSIGLGAAAATMATIDRLNAQPASAATATAATATPVDGAPIAPPASNEDASIASPEFQETSGPISTDPEWAGVSHILYRDPLEIEAVDQAADDAQTTKIKKKHIALQEFVPLDAATLAFLAVRYGGLERDPAFLERIQAKAGAKGVSIEQYLASQESDEQVRADVLKDFAETHPLLNQQGNPLPFVAVRLEARKMGMGPGLPVMALIDNKGNVYRDSGNKTTVELKLGEKFTGYHARNMARTYIARRRNPTTDGEQQEVRFNLSTGRGLLRSGLGLRDKDKYEQSLMLLAVLQEAELGGVKPVIGTKGIADPIKKISPDGKDNTADFGVHPRALEEMRLQCPEIDSLIEKYNNGWPKKAQQYSLEGEEPKADAPVSEADTAQADAEDTPAIEDPRVEQHPEPVAAATPVTAEAADTGIAPAAEAKPADAASDMLTAATTDTPAASATAPVLTANADDALIARKPAAGVPKVEIKGSDIKGDGKPAGDLSAVKPSKDDVPAHIAASAATPAASRIRPPGL